MAKRWTVEEEYRYREELTQLYVSENKTISEIGRILKLSDKTVFVRLRRLSIPINREGKSRFNNRRSDLVLPERSEKLAEFLGIMLGDGALSKYQATVCLGNKEYHYVLYVQCLISNLFRTKAHISRKKHGYHTVYIGSTQLTSWLREQGLVSNKVVAQVNVPTWVMEKDEYMRGFVRGFFDTDGSVYRLRFGIQISITNCSLPLLQALQFMLRQLKYSVSEVSAYRIYVTRRKDVRRFFSEIRPMNKKHLERFDIFARRWWSGKHTTL